MIMVGITMIITEERMEIMGEFKKHYWIRPIRANKYHIHTGDGRSLCGSWLMTAKDQEVSEEFGEDNIQHNDCKKCCTRYLEEKAENDTM